MIRQIHYRDNLPALREMPESYVDIIYLDPPFNSKRAYNIIYKGDVAQTTAFVDIWHWSSETEQLLDDIKQKDIKTWSILWALINALGKTQICCYLVNMAIRLVELRRILKPTGSIYLHCDPTASHYLKITMDQIFGELNFRNEVIWHYGLGGSSSQQYSKKHDVILFYTKGREYYFDKPQIKATSRAMAGQMKGITDVWDIPTINNMSKQRTGYPTQKPSQLLERIIEASSSSGGLVLDPFCGCGTTLVAAEKLDRQWIGIDITYTAIGIIKDLLDRNDLFSIWDNVELVGQPKTDSDIEELLKPGSAAENRKEFEKFCVVSVGGYPNQKWGADGGIDGRIPLHQGDMAVIEVKSGNNISVKDIRALDGVVKGKNKVGVFITRHRPTRDMVEFAAKAGLYRPKRDGILVSKPVPKIQILELKDILAGERPKLPV